MNSHLKGKKKVIFVSKGNFVDVGFLSLLKNLYEIIICSGYADLSVYVKKYNPSLVLIALDSGQEEGFIIETIKGMKLQYQSLPIVLLVGSVSNEFIIEAFRTGVRDFLKIPIDELELMNRIEILLVKTEMNQEKRNNILQLQGEEATNFVDLENFNGSKGVQSVLNYIQKNYSKAMDLDELSEEACMSKFHLCEIFKKEVGMTCIAYLNYFRIIKAKTHLLDLNKTITQVAFDVGYESLNSFGNNFRHFTGMTPSEYRLVLKLPGIFQNPSEIIENPPSFQPGVAQALPKIIKDPKNRINIIKKLTIC